MWMVRVATTDNRIPKADVVYIGVIPVNISKYLIGDKQTNNRAELSAAIIALEQAKQIKISTLSTDSKYVKEGITKWIMSWKHNGSSIIWGTLIYIKTENISFLGTPITYITVKCYSGTVNQD